MNKFAIPSILTGLVLIAGIFALMPIYEASTVHNTILNTTIRSTAAATFTDWDDNEDDNTADELTLTCTAPAVIHEIGLDLDGANYQAGDNFDLVVDVDGTGNAIFGTVTQDNIFSGATPVDEPNILATRGISNGVILNTFGFVSINNDAEADGADEGVQPIALYTSQGTCTWTLQ